MVHVHGPRVTAVQVRTRCSSIKADLATLGPQATPENASPCRTEAGDFSAAHSGLDEMQALDLILATAMSHVSRHICWSLGGSVKCLGLDAFAAVEVAVTLRLRERL